MAANHKYKKIGDLKGARKLLEEAF